MNPIEPMVDDNQPDYPTGHDPGENDDDDDMFIIGDEPENDEEFIIPDDHGPSPDDDMEMPGGIQNSGETSSSSPPSTFSNPDIPIEQVVAPDDDDPSPDDQPVAEPIRVGRKQRTPARDSTDDPPRAEAKVVVKRPRVQLPGHVELISVPVQRMHVKKKMLHMILLRQVHTYLCLLHSHIRLRQVIFQLQKIHRNRFHRTVRYHQQVNWSPFQRTFRRV